MLLVAIAGVALAGGLTVILWPSGASPAVRPPPAEKDRAASVDEPAVPALPESAPARTISPRPFDAPPEVQKTGPEAAATTDGEPVVISGQVVDFDRKPAAGAPVFLHLMRDEAPASPAARLATSDRDGHFTLSVPRPFPQDWMLVAFRPMRRPATLRRRGEPREPLELVLGEGAAIEGTVSLDGMPAAEARVAADIRPGVPGSVTPGDELWWAGQAFEAKRIQTVCDESGRFRVTGLAEADYQLEASQLGKVRMFGVNPRVTVRAPATGVRLEAATARLRVKVMGDGKVLDRARIALITGDGRQFRSDSAQFADIRIAPGVPMTIDAAFAGFEPKTVTVGALGAGEARDLQIVLDPASSPRLELRLQGATAMGLKSVVVKFVQARRTPDNENRALEDLRQVLLAQSIGQDEFVLEHVPHPPGAYFLVVIAGSSSWLLPIQKEVVLPASGVLQVSAEAVAGGRFNVSVRDPGGAPVGGEFVLRDLQGAEILTRSFGSWGSDTISGAGGVRAEAADLARTAGILAAGTYELEVKCDGFKPVRRQVTVKASSLVVEEVRLERADSR